MANPAEEMADARRMAQRAVEFGSDDALALAMGGTTLAGLCHELEAGGAHLDRAITLNPNLAIAWTNSGLVRCWLGEIEVSIDRLMHAMRLNPLDPFVYRVYAGLALSYFCQGRYEEAVGWGEKARLSNPNFSVALVTAAACLSGVGRIEEAKNVVGLLHALNPAIRISNSVVLKQFRKREHVQMLAGALRKAGMEE